MPTSPPGPLHLTPANAPRIAVAGDLYTLLVTGEHTAGAFTLVDALVPPGGGPPPHTHSREDESFYIIEGTMTFTANGRTFTAGPGESVHIPRGIPHHFHNSSDRPVRMLFQCIPAGIEHMFLEAGTPVSPDATTAPAPTRDDIDRLLAAAERAGITIHVPGR